MINKYRLLEDPDNSSIAHAGDMVYDCKMCDYGSASTDSVMFKEPYISVTLDPEGDYPFFTVPVRQLEKQ